LPEQGVSPCPCRRNQLFEARRLRSWGLRWALRRCRG
jgi:hypothetical protein